MRIKLRIIFSGFLLLFLFAVSIKYAYSEIDRAKYNEIRVAYMNGYYEALQLDVETILPLKSDDTLLKRTVLNAADKYITLVEGMNK